MARRDIIVVGASAGGVEALSVLVSHLPRDLPAALFVAWHTAPYARSFLPAILERGARLPVAHAIDGEPIRNGRVYVAPPDHHLLLERGKVRLTRGPKENRFRPAVDPLFRSAAYSYGPRVVGVVLSGSLDDGTAGLWAIKDRGGKAIVQDPTEARHPSMPLNALQHVEVDYRLPVAKIAETLASLAAEPAGDEAAYPISDELDIETRMEREGGGIEPGVLGLGQPSVFGCPECHGTLFEIRNGNLTRYRCHTGHAYSVESLLASLIESGEQAIESAVRSMQESALLLSHLGKHARKTRDNARAAALEAEARASLKRAEDLKRIASAHGSIQRAIDHDHAQDTPEVPMKRASR